MNDVNFDIVVRRTIWWKRLLSLVADLESIPAILLKADSTTEAFSHGFWGIALLKISQIFLWSFFVNQFLRKLQASNPKAATYRKCCFWQKYIELNFNSKWGSYCVKNNFCIWMPMLMALMPIYRCRDFQVASADCYTTLFFSMIQN